MKFLNLLGILFITITTQAQQLKINPELIAQSVEEVVLPVSEDAYVLVKDSIAYAYKIDAVLPYKKQNLKNSYILDVVNNRVYSLALVSKKVDQVDEFLNTTTLVYYKYEFNYCEIESAKTTTLMNTYGYFIPKIVVSEFAPFNGTLNADDLYTTSIYESSDHLALPSHYLRIDKNNVLAVLNNGYLVLSEAKNHKVAQKKYWGNFNGTLSLQRSVKIGDFARITFQRYREDIDDLETFWSILDLKKQIFVPINLEQFYSNLENIEEQDISLLNSTPLFYKALNSTNIRMFVLPDNNYVWVNDQSYYYGSKELSKYAILKKDVINYNLNVHTHIYDHPARILRAIAPQETEKIKAFSKSYELKKRQ
ncbi:hypothetical protein [Cochleicola gelatinilyticus]|uniref:Uncharacterized protein n=1 Tax=Cochleicola gelatinilyticus TaxID=1763537 RepID=A0A167K6G0_9FLAO|nr:hypothetical protein [Cochleicola gelatinilyticus]OAB81437.1 hypothetical protein ULVI_01035 [Cochleicola gelatinilyticus]